MSINTPVTILFVDDNADIRDSTPAASATERAALKKLVQTIMKSKEADATADVSAWEAEINARVYRLFGLTPDEIATIEATA